MDYDVRIPKAQGLYDPRFEHDACGVGFVCNYKGKKSPAIISQGLEVLRRLSHRGATGADPRTGDGAGILIQIPHDFFACCCERSRIALGPAGSYGTGLVFLPTALKERNSCKELFGRLAASCGLAVLGWRSVPVNDASIGLTARQTQPMIEQPFIGLAKGGDAAQLRDGLWLERRLYLLRRKTESAVRASGLKQKASFYITNLSSRTFSYKGLLMPEQVREYFCDLKDHALSSAICLVHSRYSTNTFPTWNLSQPFRYLAHNGEINTLRGNVNWMRAREGLLKSALFKKEIEALKPVIVEGGSDSAMLDNVFELLYLAGRPLAHVMMMLIPAAWERNDLLAQKLKAFYKYHGCLMEPWDGPAAVCFTDGTRIGAVLDRNGLRPCRYLVTRDERVIMSSEVGVLDVPAESILHSGRLEPGRMFFINTQAGRIIEDQELKEIIAAKQPYASWLDEELLELDRLPQVPGRPAAKRPAGRLTALMKAFGYTREDLKTVIKPMIQTGQEPVGAMGNDTPHAVLSQQSQPLYSYFKQLFAQVTNPAIDPIREELVMSLDTYLGPQSNLLEETSGHCRKIFVKEPILSDEQLGRLRGFRGKGFKTRTLDMLFDPSEKDGLVKAINRLCREAKAAIKDGYTFICLSDRGVNKARAGVPALLAVGAVHHYLVGQALRSQISILVESAEPREVHHFALLFGYGADCINPYLAYEVVDRIRQEESLQLDAHECRKHYIKALNKGIMKILSKMGISTLRSYRGAQIFEAVGISAEVIERCFPGTVSRIGGITFKTLAEETLLRHAQAFSSRQLAGSGDILATGGLYQFKRDGEFHLWNPESIAALQDAARNNDRRRYDEFSRLINDQSGHPATLRSLFTIRKAAHPLDLSAVESADSICRRFATGAMSFGSISGACHRTIAIAMNRLGGRSNTGEGGEDPARFVPLADGGSMRSAIKQVASGRFGVTTNYLVNADEIQIKIAQGAKPGEGGQLPGHKVSAIIARTRYTTPGVTLISPPPHHDIYSIEDLAQLIFDLKNANPRARISVKLVSEAGVGTVAAGVAKGHADMILISGGDGGTGASPLSSIKHAGLPWELGLAETHQTLVLNDLRSRVRLQTDGQMRTGRDVAVAAMLGAEEYGFCTAVLVTLGCVMLRHCNLNNCSVGVATQDELLEKRFSGKPEYVENYLRFVAAELRQIIAECGVASVDGLIGRTDLLEVNRAMLPWKARGLDLSRILYRPQVPAHVQTRSGAVSQEHTIDTVLDRTLISLSKEALEKRGPVKIELPIHNTDRTVGAMLSGEICRRFGEEGLIDDTIHCRFSGCAGQSFGAFLAQGVSFELEGMANDYVGKGLSGGRIVIYPDRRAAFDAGRNIIMGNTAFYGAICGQAYIRGLAGERFAIRNSGLCGVVEGVGDHGCEYMTGGRLLVLGPVGRNFGAGMSGGIAYVYDPQSRLKQRCNPEMVGLERCDPGDAQTIRLLLANHFRYTFSPAAQALLDDFDAAIQAFVKVMPFEYKRILDLQQAGKKAAAAVNTEG